MIGLCRKAGKIKSGETAVEAEMKKGTVRLLVIADNASDRTKKTYHDMAAYRKIPIQTYGSKEALGQMLGKAERAAVAVIDEKMAAAVAKKIESANANSADTADV